MQHIIDSNNEVNLPPKFGTFRTQFTLLVFAVLMGRSEDVALILTLTVEPNMFCVMNSCMMLRKDMNGDIDWI